MIDTSDWRARLRQFFAIDDLWERVPSRGYLRRDAVLALVIWVVCALGLELVRSVGGFDHDAVHVPWWQAQLAVATAALPLVVRRRYPLSIAVYLSAHMFATGMLAPFVMIQFPMQVLYFFGLFGGMAWARSRSAAVTTLGFIVVFMFGWLTFQFALGAGAEGLDASKQYGLLPPILSNVTYSILVNIFYFGAAVLGGHLTWRNARQRAELAAQAQTLAAQSEQLREHAVTAERLRIARELHDVVAHHVAVMGIQAGAARKILSRDPSAAAGALQQVEQSSRDAVGEMRALLGTLRGRAEPGSRGPEPGLGELPALLDEVRAAGLPVRYAAHDDLGVGAASVPPAVGLSLYRTVQEALANIRRHSTANAASVVLRLAHGAKGDYAEVEILDDGRARPGTGGSGLGLLGMRERVTLHGGEVEAGPRAVGGYRVRVRLPIKGVHG
ncbi:MAG: histidine kinase [Intrasporangium sp.]|uniref:sensor histidine kinase n=1 Tax=Intrasporangium sp. TaxID=1925024 RepID=UPI00264780B7|nr:histidine kinase [Intrasporangium sp.]MDN5797247.1 histidine kinase [Intrasporangium sp.]